MIRKLEIGNYGTASAVAVQLYRGMGFVEIGKVKVAEGVRLMRFVRE